MKTQKLEWEIVPTGWAVCFNEKCTKRDDCLRHQAGRLAPITMTTGCCVMPGVWSENGCELFASMQQQVYAYGFSTIYNNVLKKDYTTMRKELTMKLQNKGYYYKYMNGLLPLSPEKQQIVKDVFASFGYEEHVKFDSMESRYVFPWNNIQHTSN